MGFERFPRSRWFAAGLWAAALQIASASAADGPVPPCSAGAVPQPDYAAIGEPPAFAVWHDIDANLPGACRGMPDGKLTFGLALSARIDGTRTLDAIAGRLGAISTMKSIRYWSTSDGEWRDLISDAFALTGPDATHRRSDFSADEILSGRTRYMALDDTRSSGANVYSLTARKDGPERLVVTMTNLSALGFGPFTIFEPGTLHAIHLIQRLADGSWGYYAYWAVTTDDIGHPDKSFLNRANALFRFLVGIPTDTEPPLAR